MCDLHNALGWVALFVSVGSLSVAFLAAWSNRERLRFDLYNKRFDIFIAAVNFSNAMSVWSGSEEQIKTRQSFILAVNESRFLFSRESQVFSILSEINEKSFKKFGIETLRPYADAMPREFMGQVNDSIDAMNWIVFSAIPLLTEKMRPYLNFHQLTVWPNVN
jgi:hypothetical protein